jgi:RNA polymerase sporulation-specific sigma factor
MTLEATTLDLFPALWQNAVCPNGGLSREEEELWFARLYLARRFAREAPDSIWTDRLRFIRDFICRANMGLALSVVKKYVWNKRNHLHDEFKSAALAALLNAIDHFDSSKGNKLSTYAMRCIHHSVCRLHHSESRRQKGRVNEKFAATHADPKSGLDGERAENIEAVRRALETADLDANERLVIEYRYLSAEPKLTLLTVGRRLKLSQERVRQIEAQAMKKIKAEIENPGQVAQDEADAIRAAEKAIAVANVDDLERVILTMHFIGGLGAKAIGQRLNIPQSRAWEILNRAREKVKR